MINCFIDFMTKFMLLYLCKFHNKFVAMMLRDQCISITDLRTKTKACLEHLEGGEKYVFVNNKPKAVILDIEIYEQLVRPEFAELSESEVSGKLRVKIKKSKNKDKSEFINI